jgi:hypothetical protein
LNEVQLVKQRQENDANNIVSLFFIF